MSIQLISDTELFARRIRIHAPGMTSSAAERILARSIAARTSLRCYYVKSCGRTDDGRPHGFQMLHRKLSNVALSGAGTKWHLLSQCEREDRLHWWRHELWGRGLMQRLPHIDRLLRWMPMLPMNMAVSDDGVHYVSDQALSLYGR